MEDVQELGDVNAVGSMTQHIINQNETSSINSSPTEIMDLENTTHKKKRTSMTELKTKALETFIQSCTASNNKQDEIDIIKKDLIDLRKKVEADSNKPEFNQFT